MPKKAKTYKFIDDILETFGEKVLDSHTKEVTAISTGSISLNASIGIGGIPRGMITELFGPEGSGKTTVALNTAKTVANDDKKVLYIDVENLLNTSILKAVLGDNVKIENIVILTPDSAEDAFVMAEKGIESGEFELIIIDSIGAMASRKEKEIEFEKATMGQLPVLVARFIKRNTYAIRTTNIALLILNQIRDNVGSYIKGYKTPGGHQLQHQAAVRIALTKGENLMKGDEQIGILTKFVVKKNKLSAPYRSFMLPILFGHGIDMYSDVIDFAKLLGVIQQAGSYYRFGEETLGQGKAATRLTLENSKETLDNIINQVYNVVNKEPTLLKDIEEIEEAESETIDE
jgi:recombination protein RecA